MLFMDNSVRIILFIHSFIHSGYFYSIAPFQTHYYYTTQRRSRQSTDTVSEFHAKRHGQLRVKDFPKVPTFRLERNSNPRPSGRKASTLPMRHHALLWSLCAWTFW